MDFFRRPSRVGGDFTPPIQVIEELKSAVADLKDELATALEAKQYAKADLKQQLIVQETLEKELELARGQLLEAIARQQSEVAVMAAPSPNGTARFRIETEEGFELVAVEAMRDRIKALESTAQQSDAEIASLKHINVETVGKMKQLLAERHRAKDTEESLQEAKARISILEQQYVQETEEMKRRIDQLNCEIESYIATEEKLNLELSNKTDECFMAQSLRDSAIAESAKAARDLEEQSAITQGFAQQVDLLRNDLESARTALESASGEYEDQILDLINQVAKLKNDNGEISKRMEQVEAESDQASQRVETVHERIEEARDSLQAAIRSSLEAKKEAMYWRTKYLTDMKIATEKIRSSN